jgi:hypothetical protein
MGRKGEHMLSGKLYRLNRPTWSVDVEAAITVRIPEGEIIEAVEEAREDNRIINVAWKGKTLLMFRQDMGKEIGER